jgi:hypothetical protein
MIDSKFFYSLSEDVECTDWNHNEPYERHLYATNVDCASDSLTPIPLGVRWQFINPLCTPTRLALYCARSGTNYDGREECKSHFGWATITDELSFEDYIKEMADHKFTISPEGNGYDCFRTWECLYCGRYPVVKRRVFTEEFSKHLPIVVIDNWSDVTEEFLNNKYEEFQSRTWNYDLLSKEYWKIIIT